MLTIKTTVNKTTKGVTVTARSKGKQRTLPWNDKQGIRSNHAAAAGVLANHLLTGEQVSKIHHPSGAQRFTCATFNDGTGIITLDV